MNGLCFRLAIACFAIQGVAHAQANLFDHIYWDALGAHHNQRFGFDGLDTLGTIRADIPQGLAIGQDGAASFVYNRFQEDTTAHYSFPRPHVRRGNFNGDAYLDFVSWGEDGKVFVLLGTPKLDSFLTAFELNLGTDAFPNLPSYMEHSVSVLDCDSDSFDDLVISDNQYLHGPFRNCGRILFFRGGSILDSVAADSLVGRYSENFVAGQLSVGNLRGGDRRFLINAKHDPSTGSNDSFYVSMFPLGTNFSLTPFDTVLCLIDHSHSFSDGIEILDADGDGVDDILIANSVKVLIYSGGVSIAEQPTYALHKPSTTPSGTFGNRILEVGDISGSGERALLITDPEDDEAGGFLAGTVFLFPIGKHLKDSCIVIGKQTGFENYFGTSVAAMGDVNHDERSDFLIADDPFDSPLDHRGRLTAFRGDSSLRSLVFSGGPTVALTGFRLEQNFPNPFHDRTDVTFAISTPGLYGKEVTLKIYDDLGREILTAFRGTVDGYGYTIRILTPALASGDYRCVLACGEHCRSIRMTLVR